MEWPGSVRVTWTISWSASTGVSGSLPSVTRATALPRAVEEVQAVVVVVRHRDIDARLNQTDERRRSARSRSCCRVAKTPAGAGSTSLGSHWCRRGCRRAGCLDVRRALPIGWRPERGVGPLAGRRSARGHRSVRPASRPCVARLGCRVHRRWTRGRCRRSSRRHRSRRRVIARRGPVPSRRSRPARHQRGGRRRVARPRRQPGAKYST